MQSKKNKQCQGFSFMPQTHQGLVSLSCLIGSICWFHDHKTKLVITMEDDFLHLNDTWSYFKVDLRELWTLAIWMNHPYCQKLQWANPKLTALLVTHIQIILVNDLMIGIKIIIAIVWTFCNCVILHWLGVYLLKINNIEVGRIRFFVPAKIS